MAASMSLDEHRHGFAAAMAALHARDAADPTADSVGYRQGAVWLTPGELAEMIGELRDVLASRTGNKPASGRSPHLLSMILFPTEAAAAPDAGV